jgi:hypothetical protein
MLDRASVTESFTPVVLRPKPGDVAYGLIKVYDNETGMVLYDEEITDDLGDGMRQIMLKRGRLQFCVRFSNLFQVCLGLHSLDTQSDTDTFVKRLEIEIADRTRNLPENRTQNRTCRRGRLNTHDGFMHDSAFNFHCKLNRAPVLDDKSYIESYV